MSAKELRRHTNQYSMSNPGSRRGSSSFDNHSMTSNDISSHRMPRSSRSRLTAIHENSIASTKSQSRVRDNSIASTKSQSRVRDNSIASTKIRSQDPEHDKFSIASSSVSNPRITRTSKNSHGYIPFYGQNSCDKKTTHTEQYRPNMGYKHAEEELPAYSHPSGQSPVRKAIEDNKIAKEREQANKNALSSEMRKLSLHDRYALMQQMEHNMYMAQHSGGNLDYFRAIPQQTKPSKFTVIADGFQVSAELYGDMKLNEKELMVRHR